MNLRLRILAMHLAAIAIAPEPKPPQPKPPGPMPKTFSHFATVEEWEQYRKEVKEAQEQGAPF